MLIGNHEVETVIRIKISHSNTVRRKARGKIGRAAKRAIPVPQQYADAIGSCSGHIRIRDRKIKIAVAVEVPDCNEGWIGAYRVVNRWLEYSGSRCETDTNCETEQRS